MSVGKLRFDSDVQRLWSSLSAVEIAAELGCSVATVYNAAQRRGLVVRPRAKEHRWTAAGDAELRRLFPRLRPRELEKHFGLVYEQIRTRAKRLGLPSRLTVARWGVRHDYFSGSAASVGYFAGLLAADGWITARRAEIGLGLKLADRAMVDRFNAEVRSPRPVGVYREIARATVTSRQMVADLGRRWGVGPAKTRTLRPPTEPDRNMQLAYIAGHLDGDGFIGGPSGGGFIRCGAIGTEPVIRWCASVLDDVLADAGRDRHVSVWRIGIEKYSFPMFEWRTTDHSALVVLDTMKNAIGDLGIERKWARFETGLVVARARQLRRTA